ncbi:MAG TPA: hypothetical protein VF026_26660 [Ktedonobacteraceae bacterium]
MLSTTFYRLSGLALLVGGVVGAAEAIASAVLYPGHEATAQQILSFPWMLLASLYLAGFLLLALGLPGMYRHQSARTGGWGRAGFIVMLVGVVLGGVLVGLLQVATMPAQALSDPQSFAAGSDLSAGGYALFVLIPVLLIAVGAILLGVASLRARVFPRGAATLLLAAGIIGLVSLVMPSTIENILEALWNAVFFLAFGWFGFALVAQRRESIRATERATPIAQASREA